MNRTFLCLFPLLLLAAGEPPKTKTDNAADTVHGVTIRDPYRWLEDQESPQTRAWIDEQNTYARSILDALPGRTAISRRLEELMRVDSVGIPVARGGRYFFSKRLARQDQAVLYFRQGFKGKDEVLVDPVALDPSKTTSIALLGVSEDGTLLAYGLRKGGEDELTISFLDVDSRKTLPDRLPKSRTFSISILPDKSGFYYSRLDKSGSRVYFHAMGKDGAADQEIFGKGYGPDKGVSASLSRDGKYLLFTVFHGSAASRTELYVENVREKGQRITIVNDIDASFFGDFAGDRLYLETTWKAPKGRIMEVDLKKPARENWREVVPEAQSAISGSMPAGGKLVVNYLENAASRLRVFDASGKPVRDFALPAIGTAVPAAGRWESDEMFYSFTSFAHPMASYRVEVSTGRQELWARSEVPLDTAQIEVKQVWYESKDKTRIPMFVVSKRGQALDGERPALLTGYGGFNISRTPQFSAMAAYWVERGGVFAVPSLRGGGEFGEEWHRAGMFEKKQNVFDDFIAAAEWLIANRYTKPEKLATLGTSNGGLLVGAAMTQRPELFGAVICAYPLLDMVRYHRFLIARLWVSEYGSAEDPKQFPYIFRYSPYHHVDDGVKYPAVMLVTGDSDTRVAPLHARKMAARLQAGSRSARPVILHYDTQSGHSAGKPTNRLIADITDQVAFMLAELGELREAARAQ